MTSTITYHCGDVRDVMSAMPDGSVDLVVTSPPFLALRSYLPSDHPDKHREIGSEATPAAFLDTMLGLTADWRRLLAPHGSIAVEIGDTYSGSGGAGGDYTSNGLREGQQVWESPSGRAKSATTAGRTNGPASGAARTALESSLGVDAKNRGNTSTGTARQQREHASAWPLAKSLCGIPTLYTWSLAYARNLLTGDASPAGSWRIRNLLTWTRPNPPVGALGDKFRPATSFVTVACVSDKRWFDLDAVRTPYMESTLRQHKNGDTDNGPGHTHHDGTKFAQAKLTNAGAPPLDWWDANDWQPLHRLTTQPYAGSHYAAFPVALPQRLIEAMCPREVCGDCGEPRRRIVGPVEYVSNGKIVEPHVWQSGIATAGAHSNKQDGNTTRTAPTLGWSLCACPHPQHAPGIVLDPFGGSGTTAVAAALTGRDAVLIDIDRRNIDLARQRISEQLRIVHEYVSGDTVTWTVETALPHQTRQTVGQASIFDALDGGAT